MIRWNINVTAHARPDGIDTFPTTFKQCITSFTFLNQLFREIWVIFSVQINLCLEVLQELSKGNMKNKCEGEESLLFFSFYCPGVPLSSDISPAVYWRDIEKCNFPNLLYTIFVQPNFPMTIFNKHSHRINSQKFGVPFYLKIPTNRKYSYVLFIFLFFGRSIFQFLVNVIELPCYMSDIHKTPSHSSTAFFPGNVETLLM